MNLDSAGSPRQDMELPHALFFQHFAMLTSRNSCPGTTFPIFCQRVMGKTLPGEMAG